MSQTPCKHCQEREAAVFTGRYAGLCAICKHAKKYEEEKVGLSTQADPDIVPDVNPQTETETRSERPTYGPCRNECGREAINPKGGPYSLLCEVCKEEMREKLSQRRKDVIARKKSKEGASNLPEPAPAGAEPSVKSASGDGQGERTAGLSDLDLRFLARLADGGATVVFDVDGRKFAFMEVDLQLHEKEESHAE